MPYLERLQPDYATGRHPMAVMRAQLPDTCPAGELKHLKNGARVKVTGSAITRQRPGTAKGFCFRKLEDETGHTNAIVRPKVFEEFRLVINLEPALLITGRVQNEDGVTHVMADRIEAMPALGIPVLESHNYY